MEDGDEGIEKHVFVVLFCVCGLWSGGGTEWWELEEELEGRGDVGLFLGL